MLLADLEGEPEATEAAASLRLARGEPAAAGALLRARLGVLGWTNLVAVPLLSLVVQARLALDDVDGAREAADALGAAAGRGGRSEAASLLARGRVAAVTGDRAAETLLAEAAERYARVDLPLDAAGRGSSSRDRSPARSRSWRSTSHVVPIGSSTRSERRTRRPRPQRSSARSARRAGRDRAPTIS
jgi:hypothetical protein